MLQLTDLKYGKTATIELRKKIHYGRTLGYLILENELAEQFASATVVDGKIVIISWLTGGRPLDNSSDRNIMAEILE